MTYARNNVTIHRIDDEAPCQRTLTRWIKSIPTTPPAYSWAGIFGVKP